MKRDIEVDEREIARFPGAGAGEGGLRLLALEFRSVIIYALEDGTGVFDAHPDLLDAALEAKAHMSIEDAEIEALEDAAGEAGDERTAKACAAALDGDGDARGMALVSVMSQIMTARAEARRLVGFPDHPPENLVPRE